MALKITTQIGTDKGITNEAYVRIADYQISKYGSANFRLELYQSEADKDSISSITPTYMAGVARNQQIGDTLFVLLNKTITQTRIVHKNVEIDVEATEDTPAHKAWEMRDVEEEYEATVPDLSALESGTIFAFAYGKLKEKLITLFGAENVVDC